MCVLMNKETRFTQCHQQYIYIHISEIITTRRSRWPTETFLERIQICIFSIKRKQRFEHQIWGELHLQHTFRDETAVVFTPSSNHDWLVYSSLVLSLHSRPVWTRLKAGQKGEGGAGNRSINWFFRRPNHCHPFVLPWRMAINHILSTGLLHII